MISKEQSLLSKISCLTSLSSQHKTDNWQAYLNLKKSLGVLANTKEHTTRKKRLSPGWWWADRCQHPSLMDLHTCQSSHTQWPGQWWWSFQTLAGNVHKFRHCWKRSLLFWTSLPTWRLREREVTTGHTFLGAVKQSSVFWCVSNLNNFSSSQQLHDEARCDDGRDTQLHQCTCNKHKRIR